MLWEVDTKLDTSIDKYPKGIHTSKFLCKLAIVRGLKKGQDLTHNERLGVF